MIFEHPIEIILSQKRCMQTSLFYPLKTTRFYIFSTFHHERTVFLKFRKYFKNKLIKETKTEID